VYYLVEEYEREVHYEHKSMDQAVFTALSSTQVVEGFFLKETRDINDTIEYLVGLHQTIDALHKVETMHQHPYRILTLTLDKFRTSPCILSLPPRSTASRIMLCRPPSGALTRRRHISHHMHLSVR
jgi:ERCC4 domain